MQTRKIGSLDASVVGLGCNNFGRRLDVAATKSVVDAAIGVGVTFFDTADIYGETDSEVFLGRVLKGRRNEVVLATKFGMSNDQLAGGARPEYVKHALAESLRRLDMDHVDLYQLHRPDPDVPVADTLGALAELVEAGLTREIGCSNFSAEQLDEAQAAAGAGPRFVSVQNEYSLLKRDPEAEVLPACERLNIAFLPYFPLFSGLLTGKYRAGQPLPQGTRVTGSPRWEAHLTDENYGKIDRLSDYAASHGRELIDLAFAWLLAHQPVASVIAGATKAEQVERNAKTAGWQLGAAQVAEVNALL